jgi:hypothetical protein
MDYFGFSLWHELLMGDQNWLDSLGIKTSDDFEPNVDFWNLIFTKLDDILIETGLKGHLGGCFHTSSNIPTMLQNFNLLSDFTTAKQNFIKSKASLEMGMHSTFGTSDLVLAGKYPEVLKLDIELCKMLGGVTIVEHPSKGKENIIKPIVEELTSDAVMSSLKGNQITLSWENEGPREFFGSLKNLVQLREALGDKLKEIGAPEIINRHQFCLDTGHLMYWMHRTKMGKKKAIKEINEYLPIFAKNIKVFHIHANDGTSDRHIIPKSLEFMDHPSRKGLNKKRFSQYSNLAIEWLKICEANKRLEGRHIHIEALRLPFSLNQIIGFGKIFNGIRK